MKSFHGHELTGLMSKWTYHLMSHFLCRIPASSHVNIIRNCLLYPNEICFGFLCSIYWLLNWRYVLNTVLIKWSNYRESCHFYSMYICDYYQWLICWLHFLESGKHQPNVHRFLLIMSDKAKDLPNNGTCNTTCVMAKLINSHCYKFYFSLKSSFNHIGILTHLP